MANLIYRESSTPTVPGSTTTKNAPLTNIEVDGNFKSLDVSKANIGANSDITSLSGLTTPLSIVQGGTGGSTAQASINALVGNVLAGKFLRGDGTNATMSNIQVSDVPTLNQNTTGSAGSLSATLAVGQGGTGVATLSGIPKGNGTSAFTVAVANVDYLIPALGNTPLSGAKTIGFNGEYNNGNSGSAISILLTNGQKQKVTLTANTTITINFTSATVGTYQLRIIQGGTPYSVTWSGLSSSRWGGSASAPAINSVASGETMVNIFWDGTNATQTLFKIGAP